MRKRRPQRALDVDCASCGGAGCVCWGALPVPLRFRSGAILRVDRLWPTPRGSDGVRGAWRSAPDRAEGLDLTTHLGGPPNPRWVEWLMGFAGAYGGRVKRQRGAVKPLGRSRSTKPLDGGQRQRDTVKPHDTCGQRQRGAVEAVDADRARIEAAQRREDCAQDRVPPRFLPGPPAEVRFPTPVVSRATYARSRGKIYPYLPMALGGPPNPAWVEWLCGFPSDWTSVSSGDRP